MVEELSKKYGIADLSIATVRRDGTISVSSSLMYPIYSITKTFIATVLLKWAGPGKINLDEKLAHFIPDAPEANRYSLRQLLNHSSGLPDYFNGQYELAVSSHPSLAYTRAQYILTYKGQLLFEPGMGWNYSNLGYMFLREVIENVSGESFSAVLAKEIFEPLQLRSCKVLVSPADTLSVVEALTVCFSDDGSKKNFRGVYHPGWVAHGLIASNVSDVARFFYEILSGTFLNQKSLSEMKTWVRVPGDHPPAVTPAYGLGLMADLRSPFGVTYGHSGGGPGFGLRASFWESGDIAVTVAFGNSETASMSELEREILRFAQDDGPTS